MRIQSARLPASTPPGRTSLPSPENAPDGYSPDREDVANLGSVLKRDVLSAVRGGVGLLGAGVGGVMGAIPGAGYGAYRLANEPAYHAEHEASAVDDLWALSYAGAGALAGGTAGLLLTGSRLGALAGAVGVGLVGIVLQRAFRGLGENTLRLPYDSQTFPSTLRYCADMEMARQVSNPVEGLLVGIKEGAHFGKLAFQDNLVPSLNPSKRTRYRA